jgi:hypothetical protein
MARHSKRKPAKAKGKKLDEGKFSCCRRTLEFAQATRQAPRDATGFFIHPKRHRQSGWYDELTTSTRL